MQAQEYTKRGWRPEPGDTVAGEVVDINETNGGYGPYYILTIHDGHGEEVDVHAFHTVLRNELARRNVQIGDSLEITYLGRVSGGRGAGGYDHYRVKGGKTPVVNWGGDAGGDSTAEAPDMPADTAGLPEPMPAPVPGAQFGDDPAW